MSRAFVKEIDNAPIQIQERPVSAAPNRVTPRGADLIRRTIADLEREVATSEDPEALALLRRDLRYWLARQSNMQVVPSELAPEAAAFGTEVTIRRGGAVRKVTIVGEDEADPAAGLIAWTAPLARVLEGAESGDVVELQAAGRSEPVTVLAVAAAHTS